jgi:hypothetical protein
VHDEPDPRWLVRDDVQRGLAAVGAAGLAYGLLVRTRELPAALEGAPADRDLEALGPRHRSRSRLSGEGASESERAAVLGGTAVEAYRLPTTA